MSAPPFRASRMGRLWTRRAGDGRPPLPTSPPPSGREELRREGMAYRVCHGAHDESPLSRLCGGGAGGGGRYGAGTQSVGGLVVEALTKAMIVLTPQSPPLPKTEWPMPRKGIRKARVSGCAVSSP